MPIRPARPRDAAAVCRLLRANLPARLRACTPLGLPGAAAYYADVAAGADAAHTLCVADGPDGLAGAAEWRRRGQTLFLNHVHVVPAARGRGLGAALLADGLAAAPDAGRTALDVLAENEAARRWYARLGFTVDAEREWRRLPVPDEAPAPPPPAVRETSEARRRHARYGFSEVTVEAAGLVVRVGRLGTAWLRVADPAAAQDADVLHALAAAFPGRALLYVGPVLPEPLPGGRGLARAFRLGADADALRRHLA